MSKAPASDLFATLRTYLSKLSEGERSPAEVASAVNHWARESADALKSKIHEEVEAAVLKMGFVKREEFDDLVAKVAAMSSQKAAPVKKAAAKKSTTAKSAPAKKVSKSPAKKSVTKNGSSAKTSAKK
jgi:BMFP domain-containing protein YqiC